MLFPLEKVGKGIFKIDANKPMNIPSSKIQDILHSPENLVLSLRTSDNSFHEVNSEVNNIIQKNITLLKKGISLTSLASEITSSKDLKIKRYLLWRDKEEAFLLGETFKALKKLASTNE